MKMLRKLLLLKTCYDLWVFAHNLRFLATSYSKWKILESISILIERDYRDEWLRISFASLMQKASELGM